MTLEELAAERGWTPHNDPNNPGWVIYEKDDGRKILELSPDGSDAYIVAYEMGRIDEGLALFDRLKSWSAS